MTDGFLCGWRVHSELPLPELAPWSAHDGTADDRAPDLVIRRGVVPDRLDDPVEREPSVQIDGAGRFLLCVDNIANYFVASPGEVIVAPCAGAAEADIRAYLLGSVFGYLCHWRGLLPLHGSCIELGGRAVILCGISGAGKSTAALGLVLRGHRLIADDVAVVDARSGREPQVLPAFPRLKLWPDALAALDIPRDGLERIRSGERDKYHYVNAGDFPTGPVPLGRVVLLGRSGPDKPERCDLLQGSALKIAALNGQVFRWSAAAALRRLPALLAAQAAVAASTPIWRLRRRFDLAAMDDWLTKIEALAEPASALP